MTQSEQGNKMMMLPVGYEVACRAEQKGEATVESRGKRSNNNGFDLN